MKQLLKQLKKITMKKILTLLFAAGLFTASYAQGNHGHKGYDNRNDKYANTSHGRYDNRDHERDHRYSDGYIYGPGNRSYAYQRQMQIERINRNYYYKMMSIQHNRYMSRRQKKFAICDAKNERNYENIFLYCKHVIVFIFCEPICAGLTAR